MPVIYLDVLLALNLFIDFLLLLATVRLLRLPAKRWRLVLAALFGAGCSCLIFLPELPLPVSALIKLAAAALILRIAFPWYGFWSYIKQITVFVIVSTIFAGLAFALWFFAAPEGFYVVNGIVYYDVSPLMLTFLTVISYGMIWAYDRATRRRAPENREYRLLLDAGAGEVTLRALHDTGNGLTDAFTGSAVVVARLGAIESCLAPDLRVALTHSLAGEMTDLADSEDAPGGVATAVAVRRHLRLIPFHSLGGGGLLPAFRPDHLRLLSPAGACRDITGAYVAVCAHLGRGEYDALIGSDLAGLFDSDKTIQDDKGHRPGT